MREVIARCMTAVSVACMGVSPAAAQELGSRQTREFVQAAGQSDQFEILEGDTVLAQSADPRIRTFAQQMIRDHGQMSGMLQAATAQAGLQPPPMGVGDDQGRLLNALQSLHGREFDQAYLRHQVLAHHSALVVEQGYAANGNDPAVRRAAAAAAPVIASHLAMIEKMAAEFSAP